MICFLVQNNVKIRGVSHTLSIEVANANGARWRRVETDKRVRGIIDGIVTHIDFIIRG